MTMLCTSSLTSQCRKKYKFKAAVRVFEDPPPAVIAGASSSGSSTSARLGLSLGPPAFTSCSPSSPRSAAAPMQGFTAFIIGRLGHTKVGGGTEVSAVMYMVLWCM